MLHFQERLAYEADFGWWFPDLVDRKVILKQNKALLFDILQGNTMLFSPFSYFNISSAFCSWFWLSLYTQKTISIYTQRLSLCILICTFSHCFTDSIWGLWCVLMLKERKKDILQIVYGDCFKRPNWPVRRNKRLLVFENNTSE